MDLQSWLKQQWDRALGLAAILLGALCLLLGWIGVSGSTLPAQQIPYLASGGLVGLFALGFGATCWLSADLRDEWRKLDDIYQRLGETSPVAPDASTSDIARVVVNTETPVSLNGINATKSRTSTRSGS